MTQRPPAPDATPRIGLREHLTFVFTSALLLLLLLSLLRLALLLFNRELIGDTSLFSLGHAFANGVRFDLRLVVFICAPLTLALAWPYAMMRRGWQRVWLAHAPSH